MDIPKFLNPETLANSAAYTAKEEVRINFTEEKIESLKSELFVLLFEKMKKEELVKVVVEAITKNPEFQESWGTITDLAHQINSTQDLATLKKSFSHTMKLIHQGYEIREEKIYGLDYQDEGVMAIYLASGDLLYQRKLTASERQSNIHSITRQAN